MQDGRAWLHSSEMSYIGSGLGGLIQQGFPSFPHDKDHLLHLLKIDITRLHPRSANSDTSGKGLMKCTIREFGKHLFKGSMEKPLARDSF